MGEILLMLDVLIQQGESIVVKEYGKRHAVGGMFFNAIICLFALVFFFVTDKNGLFFASKELIAYGSVSCLMYATGFYTMYAALKVGSFVATKLLASFSGVITIVYGIAILHEDVSAFTYIGIVLFFVSMFMINYKKYDSTEEKGFSVKWFVLVVLTVITNGMIGVITREQQLFFNSAYDNEFMILSFGGAFLFLLCFSLITERRSFAYILKHGLPYGVAGGLLNGGKNLLNLVLYNFIPIAIVTPLRTGLGFILSFILSVFLYKEKFTKLQFAGVMLGTVSVLLFRPGWVISLLEWIKSFV